MRASRSWLLWGGVTLLLWLAAESLIAGYSYVTQYRVNIRVTGWSQAGAEAPSAETVQELKASAQAALFWDDANPDLLMALGRLYNFQAARPGTSADQQSLLRAEAMDYLRQLIRLRPAWPYGYLNLAWSKVYASEFDAEFEAVLIRLVLLGRWEEKVMPLIIQFAAYGWQYISVDARAMLRPYLQEMGEVDPVTVKWALSQIHSVDYFCLVMMQGMEVRLCGKGD